MPSKDHKMPLYVAKGMKELQQMSDLKQITSTNARILVKSAEKVFKEAEKFDAKGDEESAFIMYMKYFNIVKVVRSSADYKKNKPFFDQLIGPKNQVLAIDNAEKLADSLKERYEFREAEAVASKLATLEAVGSLTEKEDESKTEKGLLVENEATSPSRPESNGQMMHDDQVMTPLHLCALLRDPGIQLIIMDSRTESDFLESHINHPSCISVPQEIIPPGTTVTHIEGQLPDQSKSLWRQRGNCDLIILVDWNSNHESVTIGTTLHTLKDALFKYDSTIVIKSEPAILEGGYEQWLLFYPMMTTNPRVTRPSLVQPASSVTSLDFDYPDFDDGSKTEVTRNLDFQSSSSLESFTVSDNSQSTSMGMLSSMPQFDRSLKPKTVAGTVAEALAKPTNLNNARNLNVEREKRSGEGITVLSNTLYPNVTANKKPEKNTNIYNEQMKAAERNAGEEAQVSNSSSGVSGDGYPLQADTSSRRLSQMEQAEAAKLQELAEKRRQQEKELAELMRKKRKVEEEMRAKEVLAEEQQKKLQQEKVLREKEEAEKKRLAEVERLRIERKKKVEEQEKEHKDNLAQERALEMAKERAKQEEEKLLSVRQAEEMAAKQTQLDATVQEEENKAAQLKEEAEQIKKQEEETRMEQEQRKREELRKKELQRIEKERAEAAWKKEEEVRLEQERLRVEEEVKQKEKEHAAALKKEEEMARMKLEDEARKREQQRIERERAETAAKEESRLAAQKNEEMRLALQRQAEEQKRLSAERQLAVGEQQSKIRQAQEPKMIPSPTLPAGWEKRLDHGTHRYYYINHNRGTTQWEAPTMKTSNQNQPGTYTARLKEEPALSSRGGLTRSHSSPDIMKQLADEAGQTPVYDRGKKPDVQQQDTVLTRPIFRQVARKRDLNPVYGNVGPALTGLRNLGNTCYMNSTIQCLNNTTPLVSYFLNDHYLNDINRDSSAGMHGEVVDEFAVVIKALWSGQYRCITPRDLKNTVGKYNPIFAGYQQQDSQEFLTFLLDGLHEGLNEVKDRPQIPEQDNDHLPDHEAARIAWQNHKLLHRSIIVELFQGQLKSTLMCRTCGKKSVTFQACMYISLPIPSSSRCTLKDCLRAFLQPEMMTGSCKWKCPRCQVERDAEKKIDIWKLPPILLIGLNRFVSDGMWLQKKTTYVDFPVSDLDMSEFTIGSKPRSCYNLYGISNHYGTMEGGHYTAYCRNPCTTKWHKFDDHEVYEMSKSDVKSSAAFVLYYTSIELRAPEFKPQL